MHLPSADQFSFSTCHVACMQAHIEREVCCGAALWRVMWSRIVNVVTLASFTLLQNVPTTPQVTQTQSLLPSL